MENSKRKTRSDKFPLTRHPTGQYCKKIKGKIYYFGSDRKQALEKYLEKASELHGSVEQPISRSDDMDLQQLCESYLKFQSSKVQAGNVTAGHYNDQSLCLKKLSSFIGPSKKISEISTLDLQRYKHKLQSRYKSANRINLHISILKAMFHWARKNDILKNIPNIDAISRCKIIHQQRATFSSQQITKLLELADDKMKAMIWLGLNCGFGCTDCSQLQWKHLDFENNRVELPRGKTGISRNLPLWPETIEALKKIHRKGSFVFYTSRGNPFVRTVSSEDENGDIKYTTFNAISTKFSRLIKKAQLDVPKGTGFYSLRRTAATLAARSGDPFSVQRLLGHANLQMATRYVQDVSKQTDAVINNSRKYIAGVSP